MQDDMQYANKKQNIGHDRQIHIQRHLHLHSILKDQTRWRRGDKKQED